MRARCASSARRARIWRQTPMVVVVVTDLDTMLLLIMVGMYCTSLQTMYEIMYRNESKSWLAITEKKKKKVTVTAALVRHIRVGHRR